MVANGTGARVNIRAMPKPTGHPFIPRRAPRPVAPVMLSATRAAAIERGLFVEVDAGVVIRDGRQRVVHRVGTLSKASAWLRSGRQQERGLMGLRFRLRSIRVAQSRAEAKDSAMAEISNMQLQCLNCKTWFSSPIQFGDSESFASSHMSGNVFVCPTCRSPVPCNKENMRWVRADGRGGWVGVDTKG